MTLALPVAVSFYPIILDGVKVFAIRMLGLDAARTSVNARLSRLDFDWFR